jgi:hypothetical protein
MAVVCRKKDCSYGPFKQARCDACCRKVHESGIPSIMRDGFKLKGYAVDRVRITRDEPVRANGYPEQPASYVRHLAEIP